MNVLIADKISKNYYKAEENISVLNNVSITVKKGEILVLMGPSGSGKSTLLNLLSLIDRPSSGYIKISNIL